MTFDQVRGWKEYAVPYAGESATWYEARDSCTDNNATLVVIDSQEEFDWLIATYDPGLACLEVQWYCT